MLSCNLAYTFWIDIKNVIYKGQLHTQLPTKCGPLSEHVQTNNTPNTIHAKSSNFSLIAKIGCPSYKFNLQPMTS